MATAGLLTYGALIVVALITAIAFLLMVLRLSPPDPMREHKERERPVDPPDLRR